nr:hypothetical protein [Tanacetum cinerariifolium]
DDPIENSDDAVESDDAVVSDDPIENSHDAVESDDAVVSDDPIENSDDAVESDDAVVSDDPIENSDDAIIPVGKLLGKPLVEMVGLGAEVGLKWMCLVAEIGAEMGGYMITTQCSSVIIKLSATSQQISESHQILFLKPSANPLATPWPSANPSETLQPLAAMHQQLLLKPSAKPLANLKRMQVFCL